MPTVDTTRTSTKSLSREERIRLRAEELYRRRGNRPGSAKEDWTRAEKEIWEEEERAIDEASEESFPARTGSASGCDATRLEPPLNNGVPKTEERRIPSISRSSPRNSDDRR